jgi:hypothetical protein
MITGMQAKMNASLESEPNIVPGMNHPIMPAIMVGTNTEMMILLKKYLLCAGLHHSRSLLNFARRQK